MTLRFRPVIAAGPTGRRRLFGLAGAVMLLALAVPGLAHAQVGAAIQRAQSQAIQRAIQNQVQQAVIPRLQVRNAITGGIQHLAIGGNGQLLAALLGDGTIRVWSLRDGIEYRRLRPDGRPTGLLLLPAGDVMAVAGADGRVSLWDLGSGQVSRVLAGPPGPVTALAVTADGRTLAAAAADRTIRLWTPADGRAVATLAGHQATIQALALSADGRTLASGGDDRTIRLWQLPEGRATATLTNPAPVTALAFDGTGRLAAGLADGAVLAWANPAANPAADPRVAPRRLGNHDGPVTALATDGGSGLASAGADRLVRQWDLTSGQPIRSLAGHDGPLTQLAFLPGGRYLVSAAADSQARIWDARSGAATARLIVTAGGWSVIDGAGRFDGSLGGVGDVDWQAGPQTLGLDKFTDSHFEPGLLAQAVQPAPQLLTPAAPPLPQGLLLPPVSRIVLPSSVPPRVPDSLTIEVTATDAGGGIRDVRLFHNGRRVSTDQIVQDRSGNDGGQASRIVSFRITPVAGRNVIEAAAVDNAGVEGESVRSELNFAGETRAPTLHLVAVGVNGYADPALRLSYAVPDARAVAGQLADARLSVFGRIDPIILADPEASRAGILRTLRALRTTPAGDVVVLFLAGHGVTVGGEWYFLPHDIDPLLTERAVAAGGISSSQLRDELMHIGALRVVLLIDACKSGAAVAPLSDTLDRRLLRRAALSAGLYISAATKESQNALEFQTLGHGLFTYALLRGLEGDADRGATDGMVRVRGLLSYLETAVPDLGRRQLAARPGETNRGTASPLTDSLPDNLMVPTSYARGVDFPLRQSGSRSQ